MTTPVTTPTRSRVAGGRPARASHLTAFWFAAGAFAVQMGFGTAPTPLWPLYAARDGFGSTTVTVAFALMVVGAAIGFLCLGHLSDRYGRRRIIMAGLLLAIGASLVLILWPHLPGLLAGRLLTGVAVGLTASTATTYLADLYARARPGRTASAVPGMVATAANLGGLALGPVVAGVVAQWAPWPLVTAQAVFCAAMAVFLVLVAAGPETVPAGARDRERPARFALRPGGGPVFAGAGGLGFAAFTAFGLFSSLGAIMIRDRLGISAPFAGGLPGAVTFTAAAAGQLVLGRLSPARVLVTGAALFPAGLALVAVSLAHPALWLYLLASAAAGAGAGLLFKGAVAGAGQVAVPASRAGVLAVFFVVAYTGMGLPVIGFSVAAERFGMEAATIGLAVLLSLGAAGSALAVRRKA